MDEITVPGADITPPTQAHSAIFQHVAGAVANPLDSPDAAVAWHYGDPLGEQRTAARGCVVVDRTERAILTLTGPERLSWLHLITSQFVTDLPDGTATENLSLDGQGRVEDHFGVTELGGVTYLDTEAHRGQALATYLTRMVFRADVTVTPRPDLAMISVLGPQAPATLDLDDAPLGAAGTLAAAFPSSSWWRRLDSTSVTTIDVVVSRTDVVPLWDAAVAAGARPMGSWGYDALRVENIAPRLGVDTDERTIPHETHWVGRALHLEKGCYRGQETVSRVHNLGRAPRALVLLHIDGSAQEWVPGSIPAGTDISAGGRVVGRVGTIVDHWEYGPIALGLLKHSVPVDAPLEIAGVAAAIDAASVPAARADQAGRAAVNRLRGRG